MVEPCVIYLEGQQLWYIIKRDFWSGNDNERKEATNATPGDVEIIGEPKSLFDEAARVPLNAGFANCLRDLRLTSCFFFFFYFLIIIYFPLFLYTWVKGVFYLFSKRNKPKHFEACEIFES